MIELLASDPIPIDHTLRIEHSKPQKLEHLQNVEVRRIELNPAL
jgi:hypothetical protein